MGGKGTGAFRHYLLFGQASRDGQNRYLDPETAEPDGRRAQQVIEGAAVKPCESAAVVVAHGGEPIKYFRKTMGPGVGGPSLARVRRDRDSRADQCQQSGAHD